MQIKYAIKIGDEKEKKKFKKIYLKILILSKNLIEYIIKITHSLSRRN